MNIVEEGLTWPLRRLQECRVNQRFSNVFELLSTSGSNSFPPLQGLFVGKVLSTYGLSGDAFSVAKPPIVRVRILVR